MSQNEIQERVARMNTQLRFGKEKAALIEAYKLRTFIQLSGYGSDDTTKELERTEKVIRQLEKKRVGGVQKLVDSLVRTARRSLNPEDDTDETLLDQFVEKFEDEDEDDELDDLPEKEEEVPLGATDDDGESQW